MNGGEELNEFMLKKQNSSLSATLTNTRRELADTKMQLEYATAKLATRDNSLSIFNRQWAQLEEQLALLLGRLDALAEVRAELEASQQQAQQWLVELQEVQTELARARAEQQEALLKPPDETQLRLHPAYKKLHAHAKEMSDRAQVAEARVQQFRTDAAALNTMRHREQATFDEYRERLASQVSDEAKQRSVELAAALADRRTIELQLAQLSMSHRREAERAADLDSRLRFALREQQRATDEIARLRELVASREAERDASRSQELERTKEASAAQLLVDSLRKAAEANGATIEPSALEKELHDALGRLSGAELKASHAELDLRKVKGAQEALMAEIEAVTQTYEEVQAKNDELRQTISLKDEALARAKGDKLRADNLAAMLKQEHALLQTKVEKLGTFMETLAQLRASMESQVRKSTSAAQKKDDEISAREVLLSTHKEHLKMAQASAQHATDLLRTAQDAEGRSKEREEESAKSAAKAQATSKRLSADLDIEKRKFARLQAHVGGKAAVTSLANDPAQEQLEYYRSKVKCTLCRINDKDAIINKCMHTFCRECIQKRLDVRNRKCPACALQFDFQSVKDLFLTA